MIKWLLVSSSILLLLVAVYLEFFEKKEVERFDVDSGKRAIGYEISDARLEYTLPMDQARIFAFRKLKEDRPNDPPTLQQRHQYSDASKSWLLRVEPVVDLEVLATVSELMAQPADTMTVLQVNISKLKYAVKYEPVSLQLPIEPQRLDWIITETGLQEGYRVVDLSVVDSYLGDYQVQLSFNDYELTGYIKTPEHSYRIATVNGLTVLFSEPLVASTSPATD